MRIKIKPRLSYANVVSTLCLFVVLGGGAYATHTHRMGTQDLRNNAVTAPKIRGGAITAQKLRNNAVRPRKVATNAIRTRHVLDEAITTPKIADGAVTAQKLAGDVGPGGTPTGPAGGDLTGNYPNPLIADEAVGTENLATGAVTALKIRDFHVGSRKIASQAVGPMKLANNAVAGVKLAEPVVRTHSETVAPGQIGSVSGQCRPGERRLTGGFLSAPTANWNRHVVRASFPTSNGWAVVSSNHSAQDMRLFLQLLCLPAVP